MSKYMVLAALLIPLSILPLNAQAGFMGPGIDDVKYQMRVPFVEKPPYTKDILSYDRFTYKPHWNLEVFVFNKSEDYFITEMVFNCSGYEKRGNRTFHNQTIRTRPISAIAPRGCGVLTAPVMVQQGRKFFHKTYYPNMEGKVLSCRLVNVNGER